MSALRAPHLLGLVLAALTLPALGGCDFFFLDDPTPNQARVVLEGTEDARILLITSAKFLATRQEGGPIQVELLGADSVEVSPPYERSFNIRDDQRFFAQALPADSGVSTSARMQVLLDGDPRYDQSRDLAREILQFLYLFNQPIFADVEVL